MKIRQLTWFVLIALISVFTCSVSTAEVSEESGSLTEDALLDMPLEKLIEIETGTRNVGVQAWQSTTPIQIVSAEQLAATGQNNVFDALMALAPSMSWSSNYDLGNVVRSARMRGMGPDEVLVLIDGKRRHPTARLNSTPGTPDQGSNPVDLDLIPLAMIDHVEILLDGASAQYGSDAMAGVINFILKKPADHGTSLTGYRSDQSGRWRAKKYRSGAGDRIGIERCAECLYRLPSSGFCASHCQFFRIRHSQLFAGLSTDFSVDWRV